MIKHIGTIGIYVDDQLAASRFWTEQVGFEERARTPMGEGQFWLEVAPPGSPTCLVVYPKKLMPDWSERKPSLVFKCDDIDATCAALGKKGVKFAKELAEMPWGKFASFLDPDGNEFGLRGAAQKSPGR